MENKIIRVAINGAGRIGRAFLRLVENNPQIEVVAINDLGNIENIAYLLKYDTAYGALQFGVKVSDDKKKLLISKSHFAEASRDTQEINFLSEKEPANLPWQDLNIDIVLESTGAFTKFETAKAHITAGAKRVVITAPTKDSPADDTQAMILMGINEEKLKTCQISSNASCTTNAGSPLIQILNEKIGIEKAVLNTIHGYTASQSIVDGPNKKDWKETFIAKRETNVEEINNILKEASKEERWQGIFAVTEDPIVSSDIIGSLYGSIADLGLTRVIDKNLVKVCAWYDNEMGYTATLIKHVLKMGEYLK
ncbi:MAG: glyceraldehyde-3-phosphate dehydrogenase, type I [Parcubacteria group bacterium GW2011_GWB1_35_5]|nr:MAG: glyceraldehyde-3-phosphate dehydrogenase, type I [Parcubacteria group bacterium GW2011_GWB1_35_5]